MHSSTARSRTGRVLAHSAHGTTAIAADGGPTYHYQMAVLDANLSVPFAIARQPFRYVTTFHGQYTGKTRWPVEHSIAWLHWFRRLKIRYERYAHVHEAFLSLACALICWTRLKPLFN